ncbi:MAG: hypothetical protein N2050_02365 [Flavobacteriales bacterium]|nr:hypothetical protein [Flavobacteriales bacterium]MCX7649383.1 hypothetical protein [Flavobacteriales bacterium]MDW8432744.1 hypothetical protein [Flavobacteriales bacterium]
MLEKLALDPQRKPLLRLLEAISSEWEGDTWLFRCNNKSEQALLLDHTPVILGLLQEIAGGRALRIEVVVRESALQSIAPKPGKPSEIRQAMAEKNPELLRFIQKFNFKVD